MFGFQSKSHFGEFSFSNAIKNFLYTGLKNPGKVLTLSLLTQTNTVLSSAAFKNPLPLSELNGENGFALYGASASDYSGTSVTGLGDINGDGIDDFGIGVYQYNSGSGEVAVVFGNRTIGAGGVFELSSLNGANGFLIDGIDHGDDAAQVHFAGDFNNDTYPDLIVGAWNASPDGRYQAGEAYVIYAGPDVGSNGLVKLSELDGTDGFIINGESPGDRAGLRVSGIGDFNEDGCDDIIVGAPYATVDGNEKAGKAYILFGCSGVGSDGVAELSAVDGSNGFVINGVAAGDFTGYALGSANNFSGDNRTSVIIGARQASSNAEGAGATYVVHGGEGVGSSGSLDPGGLSGDDGFVINGIAASDESGTAVSSADLNNDGYDDLLIGAPGARANGALVAGQVSVIFGGLGTGAGGSFELSAINGINGFVINGTASDHAGLAVSRLEDFNRDGINDIIIGADQANGNAGAGYILVGKSSFGGAASYNLGALDGTDGFLVQGISSNDWTGLSVADAGDVNGDGVHDAIIGAFAADPNALSNAGSTYVLFGYSATPAPTALPSTAPSSSSSPSTSPTFAPVPAPSSVPVPGPSLLPSSVPVSSPSSVPVPGPSLLPSTVPVSSPSNVPVPGPSLSPSSVPVSSPSSVPVPGPSLLPTGLPQPVPTLGFSKSPPVASPIQQPTPLPSARSSSASSSVAFFSFNVSVFFLGVATGFVLCGYGIVCQKIGEGNAARRSASQNWNRVRDSFFRGLCFSVEREEVNTDRPPEARAISLEASAVVAAATLGSSRRQSLDSAPGNPLRKPSGGPSLFSQGLSTNAPGASGSPSFELPALS